MATAAYSAIVSVMNETAVTFTNEAMTGSGAGPYKITDTTKEVWDPATAISFKDNGVAISSSDILTVDYMLGRVTFTASKTGPITVSGKYYLMYTVTDASEVSLEIMRDMMDSNVFGVAYKTRYPGLFDVSGTLHIKERIDNDYVTSGQTRAFVSSMTAGTPFVISVKPTGTDTLKYRFWAYIVKGSQDLKVDSLLEGDVDFQLYSQISVDNYPVTFSFTDS